MAAQSSATSSGRDEHIQHVHILSRNSVQSHLFDRHGKLLKAYVAAMPAACHLAGGTSLQDKEAVNLQTLFRLGLYPGGVAEADVAYEEAMDAIFVAQASQYCHVRQVAQHEGNAPLVCWELIELWPTQDPAAQSPVVLVKSSNISREKEDEQQLDQLQRCVKELEQQSAVMQQENTQLQQAAQANAERLQAVVQDKFQPSAGFDTETPMDKALAFLQSCIKGETPPVTSAMHLFHVLSEASSQQLRVPVALETQLLGAEDMDTEVSRSMWQLLRGNTLSSPEQPGIWRKDPNDSPGGPSPSPSPDWGPVEQTSVPSSVTPVVERFLKDAECNWQFDIFGYAEQTPGHTLSLLAIHLHKRAGFIQSLHLNEANLCNYMQRIESGYLAENPYHNSVHAASVLQLTHMLIFHGGIPDTILPAALKLGTYWAATVHDYEHGGLNNDFLIKTASPLAVLYNDQSPLENHHCAAAVKQLFELRHNYLPAEAELFDHQQVRQCSINQILGTDMKKHFDITTRFQAQLGKSAPHTAHEWAALKAEERILVQQMILKCADIGHLAASPRTHRRWAYQLEEEFFRQGDKEQAMGLPISPLMDRSTQGGITRSQLGFYSVVGFPAFRAMADTFEGVRPLLEGAMTNFRHWEAGTALQDLPD